MDGATGFFRVLFQDDECGKTGDPVCVVFGIGGFALYFGWALSIMMGCGAAPSYGGGALLRGGVSPIAIFRVAFLGGYLCMLVAGWALADRLSRPAGVRVLEFLGLACCALGPLSLIVGQAGALALACFVASGVGGASLMLLLGCYLSALAHKRLVATSSLAVAFGTLICVTVSYLPLAPAVMAMLACSSASALLLAYVARARGNACPIPSVAESKSRNRASWKSTVPCLCSSACIGILLYVVSYPIEAETRFAIVGAAGIAGAALVLVDSLHGERLNEGMQLRMFLPGMIVSMLLVVLGNEVGALVGCAVLAFMLSMHYITNIGAVGECARIYQLNPFWMFGRSRIDNVVGLGAGYIVGCVSLGFLFQGDDVSVDAMFALSAVFSVLAALFYEDRYPVVEAAEAAEAIEALPDDAGRPQKGRWLRKVDVLADAIQLTPREREVLAMLSKGYDTASIERKLIISKSTVKSHTYSIYRKADIHTHSELIALIDSMELPPERDDVAPRNEARQ